MFPTSKAAIAVIILITSSLIFHLEAKSIVLGLLGTFLLGWLSNNRKKGKLPPGPIPLPIVGSLPWLKADSNKYMQYCKKKFGNIFTIQLGSVQNVIINDYELIKEFANLSTASHRPKKSLFRKFFKGRGLLDSEGDFWKYQRRFALHCLKDAGMGKTKHDENINHEISKLVNCIKDKKGEPTAYGNILLKVTSNVICNLAFSTAYNHDDPDFLRILDLFNDQLQRIGELNAASFFPWIAPLLKHKEIKINENFNELFGIARNMIKKHKKSLDPENPRDFIDLFLLEMETEITENNKDYLKTFSEEQLIIVILNLFFAGSETSSTTVLWALGYMAKYPDMQKRVQDEIDNVIGADGEFSSSDRYRLPYTTAVTQEVERYVSMTPRAVPKSNPVPIKFKGYDFPADTMFSFDLHAVHFDEKLWNKPAEFNPERFITSDGSVTRPAYLIPFGSGRRACPGESLAKNEIFMIFATLMQKFSFHAPKGDPLELKSTVRLLHIPLKFKLQAFPRHD